MPGLVPSTSPEPAQGDGEYSPEVSTPVPVGSRDVLHDIVSDGSPRDNQRTPPVPLLDTQEFNLPSAKPSPRKRPTKKRPAHHDFDSDEYVPGATPRRPGGRRARPKQTKCRNHSGSLLDDALDIKDGGLPSTQVLAEAHGPGDSVHLASTLDTMEHRDPTTMARSRTATTKPRKMAKSRRRATASRQGTRNGVETDKNLRDPQNHQLDVYDVPTSPPATATAEYRDALRGFPGSHQLRDSLVSSHNRGKPNAQKKKQKKNEKSQNRPLESGITKTSLKQRAKHPSVELTDYGSSPPSGLGHLNNASAVYRAGRKPPGTGAERNELVFSSQESERHGKRQKVGLQASLTLPRRTNTGLSPAPTKSSHFQLIDEDVFVTPNPESQPAENNVNRRAFSQRLVKSVSTAPGIPHTGFHPNSRTLLSAPSAGRSNDVLVRRLMKALDPPRVVSLDRGRADGRSGARRPGGPRRQGGAVDESVGEEDQGSVYDDIEHKVGQMTGQLLSHLKSKESAVTGVVDEYAERGQRVLARTRARHDKESKALVQSLENRRISLAEMCEVARRDLGSVVQMLPSARSNNDGDWLRAQLESLRAEYRERLEQGRG